ncbi:MAG TPA: hypothetical protein VM370_10805 [Candidatus Thermoplasmatota archaeon]|nr:hypothetical protein [Candidatus Thermoplasmatota archaeon]
MRGIVTRRELEPGTRVHNEVTKAIRFATQHGEWPLDMTPAAGRALVRRPDGDRLQERWGDIVEAILQD